MKLLANIILAVCIALMFSSCEKKDNFPNYPVITFNNLSVNDSGKVTLTVNFTDGNGLLGTNATGAQANFYAVPMHDSSNGQFYAFTVPGNLNDPVMGDTVFDGYVIPNITPGGSNKELSGQIQVVIANGDWYLTAGETIRFRVWIVDQNGVHSNTIFTSPNIVSP